MTSDQIGLGTSDQDDISLQFDRDSRASVNAGESSCSLRWLRCASVHLRSVWQTEERERERGTIAAC